MLLQPDGADLRQAPLTRRRQALEAFGKIAARPGQVVVTPCTRDLAKAEAWLDGYGGTDGVVAKRLDGAYASGERAMIKVKRLRTADCVVGGFRYESMSREVGSLLLGLYDAEGRLDHVGFTATIPNGERRGADPAPRGFAGAARLHRQGARRAEPLEHRTQRRMGAACGRNSSSRCGSTTSQATGSAMGRGSCAGARTRRRGNAPWTRSPRRRRRRQGEQGCRTSLLPQAVEKVARSAG